MTVYVLIWEDRHTDTDARLFSTTEKAVTAAKANAREYLEHRGVSEGDMAKEIDEELTPAMERGGWLYFVKVGGDDGPSGRVVAREVE